MNKIESHDTGETCNVCGSKVVNEYGRVRCSNVSCLSRDRDNDLSWDSDEEAISAVRSENRTYVGPAS